MLIYKYLNVFSRATVSHLDPLQASFVSLSYQTSRTMQQVAKSRMSATRVYDVLTKKMDRETAQVLVDYMEEKIPADIQESIKYLATKEDVANVKTFLREDISRSEIKLTERLANSELRMTQEIAHVKGELKEEITQVKGEIVKTETKLTEKINGVETRLTEIVMQIRVEVSDTRREMERNLKAQTRWMIGVLLTLMGLIVTLYMKK